MVWGALRVRRGSRWLGRVSLPPAPERGKLYIHSMRKLKDCHDHALGPQ